MNESNSQTRFFDELLANYPRLLEFWDRPEREFRNDQAAAAMGALSSGERVALKALASIWLGRADGGYELDLTDLAQLPQQWRKPLVKWLCNPYFP